METLSKSRTSGFLIVSVLTHVALAAGVMAYKAQNTPPEEKNASTQILVLEAGSPEAAPAAPSAPVASTPEVALGKPAISEAPVVAPKAAVTEAAPVEAALPVLDADLSTPESEESGSSQEVAAELKDEDLADVLQSDESSEEASSAIAAAQSEMDQAAEQLMQEKEAQLAALRKQQEEEQAARMAEERARRQEAEKAALAAAAAERLAKEAQAAREAEQARIAEGLRQAEEARLAEKAKAEAITNNSGAGAGNGGQGVRALGDLKQMPGNKQPLYAVEERRRGLQGEGAFVAYVSKDGRLIDFKMLQSSGHRELDAKTLKAIKQWRFYPGQEGWVEIPFKWDLNGEPQVMPTTLRRRAQVSQSPNG